MYTVVIERKIGDTQFVTFTGRIAAQNMVDRAKQNSNVISAVIRDDAPRTTQQHNRETCDLGASCERCYPKTQLPRKTQAELIRAYWPVLTVEERVQFLTNAAPETEHIEIATWNDGQVYMRDPIDGAWSVHVFTGV